MDRGEYLQELLSVLFEDTHDLERFLALNDFPIILSGETNLHSYAGRVSKDAIASPRMSVRFFQALTEAVPDRAGDIARVENYYRVPLDEDDVVTSPLRQEGQDEFTASLRAVLAAVAPPPGESGPTDQQRYPWMAAACVLGRFWPMSLRPLPGGSRSHTTALTALADLVHVDFTGHWSLRDDVRSRCLRRVIELGHLDRALAVNVGLEDGRRAKFVELLRHGRPRYLAELETGELDEYSTVLDWMQPLRLVPESTRLAVQAALERRLVLDPLRALVGRHFVGRGEELRTLEDHVRGRTDVAVLVVQGAGGAGKSTLIGKVLLELERQADRRPISFAYLDFDRTANDPRHPARLLANVARQLRLLYALDDNAGEFAARETFYRLVDRQMFEFPETALPATMIDQLARQLTAVRRQVYGDEHAPPLVLVLDTFEEVQAKGPGAVDDVLELIGSLRAAMPGMKVIISGRGASGLVCPFVPDGRVLDLRELDNSIAEDVLVRLGVSDHALRAAIVAKFGGNPLTLSLAAEAVADLDGIEPTGQADALTEVAAGMVQGMLYGRILSHIADPEVVRVAHPGLAVRRITVGVLRDVLAEPCGLDPARAEAIFAKLGREVGMFEREDGETLWHRQDVRRLMLQTMLDEPGRAATVALIHQRAITYYRERRGLAAAAEELYHLLMSDHDPRDFPELWTSELGPLLEPALSEPLPARARRWLERRLGRASGDDRADWNQQDWEAEAASRAASWLLSRKPDRALRVLAERPGRLSGSRLFAIEVDACLSLGRVGVAERVLSRGVENALASDDRRTQEQLAERAVRVHAALNNLSGVVSAARWAANSCDFLGQPGRGVDVLAYALRSLVDHGGLTYVPRLGGELANRFTRLPRQVLRMQPDMVCRVLHAAGEAEPALLHHAAAEAGEPEHRVFKSDAFVLDRLLARVPGKSLAELADQLGLRADSTTSLAGQAARIGRAGHVVSFVLDHATDPAQVRQMIVEGIVRPVAPLFPRSEP